MKGNTSVIEIVIYFFLFLTKIWKLTIVHHTLAKFCGGSQKDTNVKRIHRSKPRLTDTYSTTLIPRLGKSYFGRTNLV